MKIFQILLVIVLASSCGSVYAQIHGRNIDGYRGPDQEQEITISGYKGLDIDKASPDDVIKTLGNPKKVKDHVAFFQLFKIDRWLNVDPTDKRYKRLAYEGISPFFRLDFYFLDNRLMGINFEFIDPESYRARVLFVDDLDAYFGTGFKPYLPKLHQHFPATVNDFINYSPPPYDVREYKSRYYVMTAITEKTFIVGAANSVRGFFARVFYSGHIDHDIKPPHFLGFVSDLQIVSRTLEKK